MGERTGRVPRPCWGQGCWKPGDSSLLFLPLPNPLHCPKPLPHGEATWFAVPCPSPGRAVFLGNPFSHAMDGATSHQPERKLLKVAARSGGPGHAPEGLELGPAPASLSGAGAPFPAFISGPTPSLGSGADTSSVGSRGHKASLASTASVCPQGLRLPFGPMKTSPRSDMSGFLRVLREGQPHFPSRFCSPLLIQQNSDLLGAQDLCQLPWGFLPGAGLGWARGR